LSVGMQQSIRRKSTKCPALVFQVNLISNRLAVEKFAIFKDQLIGSNSREIIGNVLIAGVSIKLFRISSIEIKQNTEALTTGLSQNGKEAIKLVCCETNPKSIIESIYSVKWKQATTIFKQVTARRIIECIKDWKWKTAKAEQDHHNIR